MPTKYIFIQPRFDGTRFSENTLPVEVARDLAAYETLVLELAKHLYLNDHPDRQRVPKGFGEFQLHIQKLEEGSARPLLAAVLGATLVLGAGASPSTYFDRARDLITECVAAPIDKLPQDFPPEFLVHFNRIGCSLKEGERMELAAKDNIAVLTPERRRQMVLAADRFYEREVEVTGMVAEADWEKSTFKLRVADTGQVTVVRMSKTFAEQIRKSGGRKRDQVTVKGIGTFDSFERLLKIETVDAVEVQPDSELSAMFDSILALQNGWLDGQALAPDPSKVRAFVEKMIGHYPDDLLLPIVVPTPDGNLLLEWRAQGDPSVDIDLASMTAFFHAFKPDGTDLETTYPVTSHVEWAKFMTFLETHLPPADTNE